jgi:hypothetical protein
MRDHVRSLLDSYSRNSPLAQQRPILLFAAFRGLSRATEYTPSCHEAQSHQMHSPDSSETLSGDYLQPLLPLSDVTGWSFVLLMLALSHLLKSALPVRVSNASSTTSAGTAPPHYATTPSTSPGSWTGLLLGYARTLYVDSPLLGPGLATLPFVYSGLPF